MICDSAHRRDFFLTARSCMQLSDFNLPNLSKAHSNFLRECYILDTYILAYSKTYALLWGMNYFVNYSQSRGALAVSPGHSFMDTFCSQAKLWCVTYIIGSFL